MKAAVVLVATITIAAAAGTAVSLAQRPPAASPTRSPVVDTALPSNQPAVAFGFAIASDLASHTLVLFGGVDDFDTTWLWNGAFWVRAHPTTSPPGRYGASEAFDPLTGEVLLFGGTLQSGQAANDTWAWDGSTWQERDTGHGGPWGGAGSDMAWDPTLNEMVLVTLPPGGRGGGQTWLWNGAHWVRVVAGDLGTSYLGSVIAFDPLSSSLMAEGCCQLHPMMPSTWRWNGRTWSLLRTSVHPLDGSSMVEDPSLRRLVLCGCDLAGGLSPEMWVWNGLDWMAGSYPRPPVAPQVEIIDAADSQFLVLGSAIGGVDALAQTLQVWALRGTQWLRLGVDGGHG